MNNFTWFWAAFYSSKKRLRCILSKNDAIFRKHHGTYKMADLKTQLYFFCIILVKLDALYLKILNSSNRLPFMCKNKKKNEGKWDIVNLNCCQMPYFLVKFNSFTLENRLNWPNINVIKPVYAFEGHSINFQHKNSNLVLFSIINV